MAPRSPRKGAPVSRLGNVHPLGKTYLIGRPEGVFYAPLPMVNLSFDGAEEEEVVESAEGAAKRAENVLFTEKMIRSKHFSPVFADLYDSEMTNLLTGFVDRGEGWHGRRVVPHRFHFGKEGCSSRASLGGKDPNRVLDELARRYPEGAPYSARHIETAAMNALSPSLPLTTKQVILLHWVCHHPSAWAEVRPTDIVYSPQWLDTHSHPTWYYPKASLTDRRFLVLLWIRVPARTPVLRIRRYSHYDAQKQSLQDGEWMHRNKDPSETEVRLPPCRLHVRAPPEECLYAGRKTLLLRLDYEPIAFRK